MYNVLLVDDESAVTAGLTAIIDWDALGCRVVGSAYNGEEGMQLAETLRADIVVTDIRMPYVDGLTMIAAIQRSRPLVRFIILSGFSDFRYARTGMELGVKHYVLKPVEEKELEASIEAIVRELDEEGRKAAELERLRTLSSSAESLVREQLLRDLLHAGDDREELVAALESAGLRLDLPFATCLIARLRSGEPGWVAYPPEAHRDAGGLTVTFRYSPRELIALALHPADSRALVRAAAGELGELCRRWNAEARIGIGSTRPVAKGFAQSFVEARLALDFIKPHGDEPLFYEWQQAVLSPSSPSSPQAGELSAEQRELEQLELEKLERALDSIDADGCARLADDWLAAMQAAGATMPAELRRRCGSVYALVAGRLTLPQIRQLNALPGGAVPLLKETSAGWNPHVARSWLTALLQSFVELMQSQEEGKETSLIEDVRRYIDHHFADALTLTSVAERFFITPNYLSQLFRKRYGVTFLACLTRNRIEKAKQLLQYSNMKIYEIGRQVGYEDLKYFRQIFEKRVGCTPSEYRSQRNPDDTEDSSE